MQAPTQDHDAPPIGWRGTGAGPIALFLHGLGGSRTSWEPQLLGVADVRLGLLAAGATPAELARTAIAALVGPAAATETRRADA